MAMKKGDRQRYGHRVFFGEHWEWDEQQPVFHAQRPWDGTLTCAGEAKTVKSVCGNIVIFRSYSEEEIPSFLGWPQVYRAPEMPTRHALKIARPCKKCFPKLKSTC